MFRKLKSVVFLKTVDFDIKTIDSFSILLRHPLFVSFKQSSYEIDPAHITGIYGSAFGRKRGILRKVP